MADKIQRRMPTVTSAPHILTGATINNLLAARLLCFVPMCILGAFCYGMRVVLLFAIALLSASFFGFLYSKVKKTSGGTSRYIGACTVAGAVAVMSPTMPLWFPVIIAFLAVFLFRLLFGDYGQSVFNITALTIFSMQAIFPGIAEVFTKNFETLPLFSQNISVILRNDFFASLFEGKYTLISDLLLARIPLGICTASAFLTILCSVFLFYLKASDMKISASILLSTFIFAYIFPCGNYPVNYALALTLNGQTLFGALFVATEFSSAPVSKSGRLIYGTVCGFLIAFIGKFVQVEAVFASIVICDMLSPFIEALTVSSASKRLSAKKTGFGKIGTASKFINAVKGRFAK